MGLCASSAADTKTMGNSNSRKKAPPSTQKGQPKRKKFKSAASKYGPYKPSANADGTTTWSAPKNEDWPIFTTESDLRKWLLKHVSVSDQVDQTIVRKPGTLEGTQFIINNCKNCQFWLLDFTSTITIDKCENCKFYIGPCESSLFIRDSKNCAAVMAVGQLRTRDCNNMKILLYSQTEPVIEKSSNLKFGCFHSSYFNLLNQMHLVGLNEWQNLWCNIHDFTPGSSQNWSQLPCRTTAFDILNVRPEEINGNAGSVSWSEYGAEDPIVSENERLNGSYAGLSAIPVTYGVNSEDGMNGKDKTDVFIFACRGESVLDGDLKDYSKTICNSILKLNVCEEDGSKTLRDPSICLVRTKSYQLELDMANRLFVGKNASKKALKMCCDDISVGMHFKVPNTMLNYVGEAVKGLMAAPETKTNLIYLWENEQDKIRMYFEEFKLSEST
eukprot:g1106.t1